MRTRILPLAGLLLLAAAPGLARAAAPADDRPAIVVTVKSLDGLISDAKYIAKLAGKADQADMIEGFVKQALGKGLDAIDAKKPIGAYARVNADDPQLSEGVVLLPVADEDALVGLVKKQDSLTVKETDGVYEVDVPGGEIPPIYFRFANHYAYITIQNKDAIAKDRMIAPEKVLPAKSNSLASLTIHGEAIPAKYKDMAISGLTQGLAQAKQQEQPGETPAQKAVRIAAIDEAGTLLKSVIEDGDDLTASIDVDQEAGELSASASFTAKSGSSLAGDISELEARKSVGAALIGSDSAVNLIVNMTLPDKVREALSEAIDEGLKTALSNAPAGADSPPVQALIKAATPTLKAGELDGGFDMRGPDAKGLYTIVMGLKAQKGGDIEKALRDAYKAAPEKDQKALKLDAAQAGGVHIHQVIPDPNQPFDPNAKKLLGDDPQIYFAVRNDAILIAGGPEALSALKDAVTAKPAPGPTLQLEVSMSRVASLAGDNNPAAPEIAKKVFTGGKKDKVRLSLQGGKALTLKLSMDAAVVTFSAQMQEEQNK